MAETRANFFVLTGASGSGKSTVIAALQSRGQVCVEEIGRQVVREQLRSGGDATPWQNPARFMALLLAGSIRAFDSTRERALPVFFDRGIPEGVGSLQALKDERQRARHVWAAANFRYNSTVFYTPPWREIYATDAERRHSFEEGVAGHRAELAAYVKTGYTLIEVPKGPVDARVEFILEQVRKHGY